MSETKLKCEVCGSPNIKKEAGEFVCENCGIKYTFEEVRRLLPDTAQSKTANPAVKTTISYKPFLIGLIAAAILNVIYFFNFSVADGFEVFSFVVNLLMIAFLVFNVKWFRDKKGWKATYTGLSIAYIIVVLLQAFEYVLYRYFTSSVVTYGSITEVYYYSSNSVPLAFMQIYTIVVCVMIVIQLLSKKKNFKLMFVMTLILGIVFAGFHLIDIFSGIRGGSAVFSVGLSFKVWRMATDCVFSVAYALYMNELHKTNILT